MRVNNSPRAIREKHPRTIHRGRSAPLARARFMSALTKLAFTAPAFLSIPGLPGGDIQDLCSQARVVPCAVYEVMRQ
jgi:hypothetical protein